MPDEDGVLSWLHIGDLHITKEIDQNHTDLKCIVNLVKELPAGSVDFAVLPGDSADNGAPEQSRLLQDAITPLLIPLHILSGDHDYRSRALNAFYDVLGAERLPKAITARSHRCLFLDVVSAGIGGPDFRLGEEQLAWAERELGEAEAAGQDAVVFMHTYPADLREDGERLGALLSKPHVTCVDMGHTHYNELANDGATIFMVTRSTGQIEEGPAGFSIAAVDGRGVSWRFKPRDAAWPSVLITRPTDRRLATEASRDTTSTALVRAKVLGDAPMTSVQIRADGATWMPMRPTPGDTALWEASPPVNVRHVTVRACGAKDRLDEDQIEPAVDGWTAPKRQADRSDADRIEAWPERGIFGTQLGLNRNGRKW